MDNSVKRLYKSNSNKMVDGVCAGIAQYFAIDPSIVRLAFVLMTVFGGVGIVAYIVLMFILPREDDKLKTDTSETVKKNAAEFEKKVDQVAQNLENNNGYTRKLFGIIAISVGVYLLLANFDFVPFVSVWKFWPLVFVALGLVILKSRSDE